jgi:hypothetical protein
MDFPVALLKTVIFTAIGVNNGCLNGVFFISIERRSQPVKSLQCFGKTTVFSWTFKFESF